MPVKDQPSVGVVVVTRDRRELLQGCLERLRAQERKPDAVLVVDNQSSDGTSAMVQEMFPEVALLRLEENSGGAGGFHAGMAAAYEAGHDWIWLMDDDSWTEPTSLSALLDGLERAPEPPLVLGSVVRWKDGTLHPMNEPWLRWRRPEQMAAAAAHGLLLLRHNTFVSALISREAVARHGLPLKHYFIWTDDFEYTGRVLRDSPGYLVPESVVWHWTVKAHSPWSDAGPRFYYFVRNSLLMLRGQALEPIERFAYFRMALGALIGYVKKNRGNREALDAVRRGVRDGLKDPVR